MTAVSSLTDAAAAMRSGSLTSLALVEDAIAQADRLDTDLRVYTARFDESARAAAEAADADFRAGIDRGPLQGMPISIKDNALTEEGPTTGASLVTNPTWEEQRDAAVVARLRAAGAVITGKTTLLEFAVGVPEPSRPLTEGRNPWSLAHWAGGSSTGAASGVAANMVLGALGSDTGGSLRLPPAFCGVTGLKPTYGRVPKSDVIPLGYSLDAVGPIARSAADVAALLQVMAGPHPDDPTTVPVPVPDFSEKLGASLEGMRIGVERKNHLYGDRVSRALIPRFEDAVAELEAADATLCEVELSHYRQMTDAVMLTVYAEGQSQHHRELSEQWEAYGPPTRLAFANGSLLSAADYVTAQRARRVVQRQTARVFQEVDVIVHPTVATGALAFDGFNLEQLVGVVYAHYWNAVGCPAITVPMGFDDDGLPLGITVAGRAFDESTVIQVADAYQRRTDWHRRLPPLARSSAVEGDRV